MELTHTCYDGLACLLICVSLERGILLSKLCQCLAQLVLARLCLGLDSELDDGIGELHGLQYDGVLVITDRITCSSELEAYRCCDISRVHCIQLRPLVSVHLQYTSHTLFLVLGRVQYV